MTGLAPAFFLIAGVVLARGYPLSRARHTEILRKLALRDGS
jgi:Na+/melibiose symporter-like transporter